MNVAIQYHIKGATGNAIAASIEDGIRAGRIGAGARLPAVRALAGGLRVSPTTVAAAYHTLRARGLVHGAGRRGTIVNRRPALATPPAPAIPPGGARDLTDGGPDPAMLPALKSILARLEPGPLTYAGAGNRPRLIDLARRQFEADGIAAPAIAIVSGALDGLERALQVYLRPGDLIAVEDPGYPGVLDLIAALGLIAEPMLVDGSGPLPEQMSRALRAGAQAAIITPRAHNPTGAAVDRKRTAELGRVLRRHPQVLVIEDDHAGPIAGAPALTVCGGLQHWAVIRSVSKSLGPDLRLAVMAGDAQTIARVEGRQQLGPRWVSHIIQNVVIALWSDPATSQRLRHAADTYTARRDALIDALGERGIEARGRSGLNVWIPVAAELSTVQALAESGWAVRDGERFRIKSPPGIRVAVATLKAQETERLARDIASAIRPHGRVHSV